MEDNNNLEQVDNTSVEPVQDVSTETPEVVPAAAPVVEEQVAQPATSETPAEPPVVEAVPVNPEFGVQEAPKKKGKGGIIIVLILLLAAGGFAAWYFVLGGDKVLSGKKEETKQEEKKEETKEETKEKEKEETKEKEKEETKEENKEKEESSLKKVEITSDEVSKAMSNFELLSINKNTLTEKGIYNISEFKGEDYVRILGKVLVDEKVKDTISYCGSDWTNPISIDDANKYLSKLVDFKLTEEYIIENGNKGTYNKTKEEKVEGYKIGGSLSNPTEFSIYYVDGKLYLTSSNCDGYKEYKVLTNKITSAEKDKDYLYVYEKRGFYNTESPAEMVQLAEGFLEYYNYYKDYEKTEFVEKLEGFSKPTLNGYHEQSNDLSWDKYNTYKYTFKLNNGNYQFQKYELVK